MRIFWPKWLKVLMTAMFVLAPTFVLLASFAANPIWKAFCAIAGVVSGLVIVAFVKVRCLRCEPQWIPHAWGGANYEK
jgi:cytochrome c oxidase assembly protein Cox11